MGGTVDPRTGKVVWKMHVPVDDQIAHYRAHPPRCLDGMLCTPIDLPRRRFDGHGEPVNALFELGCTCGSKRFTVLAPRDGDESVAPIHLECAGCGVDRVIFDSRKHGWDGELLPGTRDVPGKVEELGTSAVARPHPVVVRFEFASEVLGGGRWKGREHDLFTWFTLLARHETSGEVFELFDWECA